MGKQKLEAFQSAWEKLVENNPNIPDEVYKIKNAWNLQRNNIQSTGYVVHTLQAALWCLYNTNSYRECILTAVNLGDDTDTVAAVAGGLAGLYYCINGINDVSKQIPDEWLEKIARKDYIIELCDKFTKCINS